MTDKTLQLNVPERMAVVGLLPKNGSIVTLRMLKDLHSRIGFSADDVEKYEIKDNGKHIQWNKTGEEAIDFVFKDIELKLISDELTKLSDEEKLELFHLSIYEKFLNSQPN